MHTILNLHNILGLFLLLHIAEVISDGVIVKSNADPDASGTAKSANPLDKNFKPEKFPFPALVPFLPRLSKMLEAFSLPPGLFDPNSTEKSPALDLWKTASGKIGNNEAYRLIVICYNLKLSNEELLQLVKAFSDPTLTKEKGMQIVTTYASRLKQTSNIDVDTASLDPITLQALKTLSKIAGVNKAT